MRHEKHPEARGGTARNQSAAGVLCHPDIMEHWNGHSTSLPRSGVFIASQKEGKGTEMRHFRWLRTSGAAWKCGQPRAPSLQARDDTRAPRPLGRRSAGRGQARSSRCAGEAQEVRGSPIRVTMTLWSLHHERAHAPVFSQLCGFVTRGHGPRRRAQARAYAVDGPRTHPDASLVRRDLQLSRRRVPRSSQVLPVDCHPTC